MVSIGGISVFFHNFLPSTTESLNYNCDGSSFFFHLPSLECSYFCPLAFGIINVVAWVNNHDAHFF